MNMHIYACVYNKNDASMRSHYSIITMIDSCYQDCSCLIPLLWDIGSLVAHESSASHSQIGDCVVPQSSQGLHCYCHEHVLWNIDIQYLVIFLSSAVKDTALASIVVCKMWERPNMCGCMGKQASL